MFVGVASWETPSYYLLLIVYWVPVPSLSMLLCIFGHGQVNFTGVRGRVAW
jgi:hypothetical protein